MLVLRVVLVLALSWVLFLPASPAWAYDQGAKVILVLDASGSMSGKLEGKSKIKIAREAVSGLLDEWEPSDYLGLTVYGHRIKGECEDVESMVHVGPPNRGRILRAIDGIKPTGKTPISAAVRHAAEELDYEKEAGIVILMSDGEESCGVDPCALAVELAEEAVDLKVHVVGFDLAEEKISGLKCLAENTGGVFLSAKNASELKEAFSATVQEVRKATPPGIYLSAIYSEAGDAAEDKIGWTVYDVEADGSRGRRINYSYGATARYVLSPGKYLVTAALGAAEASKEIEVEADQGARYVLDLRAGTLALGAVYAEGGEVVDGSIVWTVYKADENLPGKRKRVTYSYGTSANYILSAGKYLVTSEFGAVRREAELEMVSGQKTEHVFDLEERTLRLRASLVDGGEHFQANMGWNVYKAEGDAGGDGERVAYSYGARASYVLPAGNYRVEGKYDAANAAMDVEIKAGESIENVLNLNAGQINLIALRQFGDPISSNVIWNVYEVGAEKLRYRECVASSYGPKANYVLPEGDYLVKAKLNNLNGEVEASVAPGSADTIRVRLRPPED